MKLHKLEINFNPTLSDIITDRDVYIGGSDIPVIMGTTKFNTAYNLKLEKLGLKKRKNSCNYYTNYGHSIEPYIRNYINTVLNYDYRVACGINDKDMIRCNFDGLDVNKCSILEIKSNNGSHDNIIDYLQQMYLYMNQSNIHKGCLAIYTRTDVYNSKKIKPKEFEPKNLKLIEVIYDENMANKILETVDKFRNMDSKYLNSRYDFYHKFYEDQPERLSRMRFKEINK